MVKDLAKDISSDKESPYLTMLSEVELSVVLRHYKVVETIPGDLGPRGNLFSQAQYVLSCDQEFSLWEIASLKEMALD